jgi:hypothetical protein
LYRQAAGQFVFGVTADGTGATLAEIGSLITPVAGVGYWIFCGHDATTNQIWIAVNDGPRNVTPHSTGIFASDAVFQVGAFNDPAAAHMNGQIARLGIWKRTLTVDQTRIINNGGMGQSDLFGDRLSPVSARPAAAARTVAAARAAAV